MPNLYKEIYILKGRGVGREAIQPALTSPASDRILIKKQVRMVRVLL